LGWARLTGKIRRSQPLPPGSRLQSKLNAEAGPQVADEYLYRVIDAIDAIAKDKGKSVPQIALNWLLQRPTVSTLVIGARNEAQLCSNLGAVGWKLTPEQIARDVLVRTRRGKCFGVALHPQQLTLGPVLETPPQSARQTQ
jgi:aryl-alcohol dehydrogenase-like predicted oxidoreductase